jgi:SEC-C motif domain protein
MSQCPCGSELTYAKCCGPYLSGKKSPPTAEALMRSRYTAYAGAEPNIAYIKNSMTKTAQKGFNEKESTEWATETDWLGLTVIKAEQISDTTATVEFSVDYRFKDGARESLHEVGSFVFQNERWLYDDGDSHVHPEGEEHHHPAPTVVREHPKVGRNEPCPCGSGKKYKKCCGA